WPCWAEAGLIYFAAFTHAPICSRLRAPESASSEILLKTACASDQMTRPAFSAAPGFRFD
ncbi:MAG TPA: hypothetical protein VN617_01715, partial [Rhodoferax sp.]|nr:hypothetical protein [Rhodoferax sp.]